MRIAVITGATGGLGKAFLSALEKEHQIDAFWLVARNKTALENLANKTAKKCVVFPMDLTKDYNFKLLEDNLKNAHHSVVALVNNAGFGVMNPFEKIDLQNNYEMVQLNCAAVVAMSRLFLPYMSGGSTIYNIASVAGFMPQTYFSVYAASKMFVIGFSQSLFAELKDDGIRVVAVCPNPMKTDFFKRAGTFAEKKLKWVGYEEPNHVVACAIANAKRGRLISISHPVARVLYFLSKVMPHKWVTQIERYLFAPNTAKMCWNLFFNKK